MIYRFFHWPFWPVSMLYAGIYLNVGLLEFTYYFGTSAIHPALVALSAALFSVFLFFGVAYVPACFGAEQDGGTLADLSNLFLGRWPTYILKYVLYPSWLATWLAVSGYFAAECLHLAFVRNKAFSQTDELMIALLWLAVIAPASGGSASQLARSSIFITKISAVAIVGLAISAKPRISGTVDWSDTRALTALFESFLLWGSPALLLIGYFTRQLRPSRRDIRWIGLAGVVLPLMVGVICGVLTATGWAAIVDGHIPLDYFRYVRRWHAVAQGKGLILAFTLFTSSRFAAFNLAQLVPATQRLIRSWLIPGAILLGSSALRNVFLFGGGVYMYWTLTAAPFLPLAGVFSAAYLVKRLRCGSFRSIDQTDQGWLFAAWVIGVGLTFLPTQPTEIPFNRATYFAPDANRFSNDLPPLWIIPGWIVSFVISWIALTSRHGRKTTGLEEVAPETTPR